MTIANELTSTLRVHSHRMNVCMDIIGYMLSTSGDFPLRNVPTSVFHNQHNSDNYYRIELVSVPYRIELVNAPTNRTSRTMYIMGSLPSPDHENHTNLWKVLHRYIETFHVAKNSHVRTLLRLDALLDEMHQRPVLVQYTL
jgi:hypothetical protein